MGTRQAVGAGVTVVLFIAIAMSSLQPPAVIPADAPDQEFSAERAAAHLEMIAAEPHPMGSAANSRVREYIVSELRVLGLEPDLQTVSSPDYFVPGREVDVTNLIVTIAGTANTRAVALMAHYDTVPSTPGGNDNSAAVAALLETARAVVAGPRPYNDVVLLFTDAEEPSPRPGSRALLAHPVADRIGFVVNLEAAGGTGASLIAEVSSPTSWIVNGLAAGSADPVGYSLLTELTGALGDFGTDFDVFRNAGYPGVHFAYMHNSPIYHTFADDVAAVDLGSLQHHGTHSLAIARHFGDMDLSEPPNRGDSVFFAIGPVLVRYPDAASLPLAVLALAGLGWAFVLLDAPRKATAVLRSAGRTGLAALGAATAATVVWMGLVALRSTPGLLESWVYLVCLLGLGILVYRWIEPGGSPVARVGAVAFWAGLGLGLAIISPAASYLFVWPALGAAVSLAGGMRYADRYGLTRFVIVAAPTLLLVTPIVDIIFQMAQPRPGNLDSQIPYVVVVAIFLGVLAIALLRDAWPTRASEVPG